MSEPTQPAQVEDNRLTAREIGLKSWSLAEEFGAALGIEAQRTMPGGFPNHLEKQVLQVYNEASNRDHMGIIARQHDAEVAAKLKDGWKLGPLNEEAKTHPELLPFSQLPVPVQLKAQFFRTSVLSYLSVWKMH